MQQMISINSSPQDAYKQQNILTASPLDVVVMLYDALKKNIVLGKKWIVQKDVQRAHKHLIKAQEIVTELVNSLDMNYEMSEGLFAIYEYILRNLEEANLHKDEKSLESTVEIVDSLGEAWREISVSNKGSLHSKEG
jgi:flagellar protein FliS